MNKEKKEINEMSEIEIEQEMKEASDYNGRYFELENELEERDK